jgi:nitrogen-specific signal transduction histidine kinase
MSRKPSSGTAGAEAKNLPTKNEKPAEIAQMRVLAHDLSNALEAILQAAYLLGQSKLDDDPRRWAKLIDSSSQEAARLNREIRKLLRSLSEE